jgi:hypothetical protein
LRKLHSKFSVFQCSQVEKCRLVVPACLPGRLYKKSQAVGPQSAASDQHRHTPREHNLNYTIWTLYAESVSFLSFTIFPLWARAQKSGRAGRKINQATLHARRKIIQATLRERRKINQATLRARRKINQATLRAHTFLPKYNVPRT